MLIQSGKLSINIDFISIFQKTGFLLIFLVLYILLNKPNNSTFFDFIKSSFIPTSLIGSIPIILFIFLIYAVTKEHVEIKKL